MADVTPVRLTTHLVDLGIVTRRAPASLTGLASSAREDSRCGGRAGRLQAWIEPRRYAMAKFVVYADAGGHYRWKLVSSNGQTTASSGESFSSKSSAKKAAEAAKKSAAGADIVDE